MNILEYFARLEVASLAPKAEYIWADSYRQEFGYYTRIWTGTGVFIELNQDSIDYIETQVQLRKDGIDLYRLEWRKPTEQDIGKMCWFYSNRNPKDKTVYCAELFSFQNEYNVMGTKFVYHLAGEYARPEKYCLLTDHGQICPTPEDFERVYNDRL